MIPVLAALISTASAEAPDYTTPEHVVSARDALDWDAITDEASRWLSEYIQVDTVNPPGNERDGAEWLRDVLVAEGLSAEIVDHGDNRASLIARLHGDGSEPPLCLLSHIDVVTSEAELWDKPPLSGEIADGWIWGRGALDMKGMGIAEAMAVALLARENQKLRRDVVILAVADEELDGLGMQALVDDHWDRIGCSHLINEGGMGLPDALFEGQNLHAISAAEKGVLWARLIASGNPGHGSTIEENEAPAHLLAAMERIRDRYKPRYRVDPVMRELLWRVGDDKGGITGALLKTGFGVNLFVKPQLKKRGQTAAVLHNTVHLTGTGGAGGSTNVVPSTSWATYDCRLLPGVDPQEFFEELKALTEDLPGVRWELEDATAANASPVDDPFFDRIAHYAVEEDPNGVAGPVLSPGFTDSIYARPKGVRAYGYVPFIAPEEEMAGFHGNNERVSVENMRRAVRVLYSLTLDFAGTGERDEALDALDAELEAIDRAGSVEDLADELAARAAIDQRLRRSFTPGEPDPALSRQIRRVDTANTARMHEVVDAFGWPSAEDVGESGVRDAWLLVQHADQSPDFQAEVLAKIEAAMADEPALGRRYAYLYDRVAVNDGRPQQFGTQGSCQDGAWTPRELEDADAVDTLRADVGLQPLSAYAATFDCLGVRDAGDALYEAEDWPACAKAYAEAAERAQEQSDVAAQIPWYNAACCASRAGDVDTAFDHLEAALNAGMMWSPHIATGDEDLAPLREDARWTDLVEEYAIETSEP